MKKSRLNAISYSYSQKKKERQYEVLKKYGLIDDYLASGYKYMTNFLKNAYREKKIKTLKEVYGL